MKGKNGGCLKAKNVKNMLNNLSVTISGMGNADITDSIPPVIVDGTSSPCDTETVAAEIGDICSSLSIPFTAVRCDEIADGEYESGYGWESEIRKAVSGLSDSGRRTGISVIVVADPEEMFGSPETDVVKELMENGTASGKRFSSPTVPVVFVVSVKSVTELSEVYGFSFGAAAQNLVGAGDPIDIYERGWE